MRNTVFAASTALLLSAGSVHAQGIHVTPAGSIPTRIAAETNFTGQALVDMKTAGDSAAHGSVGMVTFAPGARTAWHVHPRGQLLIITQGQGWVQQEGQPRHSVRAGDVVWIEPNTKHWHGASDRNAMSHLAIAYLDNGTSTHWHEKVSDEQYQDQ